MTRITSCFVILVPEFDAQCNEKRSCAADSQWPTQAASQYNKWHDENFFWTGEPVFDNEKKGIVRDVTKEIGGVIYDKKIDFMSNHRKSYKQLSDDYNYLRIGEIENSINQREIYFIPKEKISGIYDKLQTGDVIGITSNLKGLDIAHTGFVYMQDGVAYLLNASLKNKQVEISQVDLQEYVMSNSKQGGIVVARVIE